MARRNTAVRDTGQRNRGVILGPVASEVTPQGPNCNGQYNKDVKLLFNGQDNKGAIWTQYYNPGLCEVMT